MGFRYRCQQCHGYQLCQSCFWRGHANGPHSNQHQMKEHSSWVWRKPRSLSSLCCVVGFFEQFQSQSLCLSMWNEFTMKQSSCITCPLKTIQEAFNRVLVILANKIVLTEFAVLLHCPKAWSLYYKLKQGKSQANYHPAWFLHREEWVFKSPQDLNEMPQSMKHKTLSEIWKILMIFSCGKFVWDVFAPLGQSHVKCMSMKHIQYVTLFTVCHLLALSIQSVQFITISICYQVHTRKDNLTFTVCYR